MDFPKSKKYDVIIMNPPFEKLQDVDHVMKAYEHLNAG
jgi:16S rRNA G1207 methylase RsmC